MDFSELLKGKHDCFCGLKHDCDIKYVEIGPNVLEKLQVICDSFTNITLVADENTFPLCGDKVCDILGDKIQDKIIFGKEIVIPNEESIAKIEEHLHEDTDLIVGIGSGVINDLCKYTSYFHKIRYVIVATAPSMDGYASVGAAMILKNMKETVNARVPFAIVAESSVISTAPTPMIQSGYGDIVGKYSCLNDWKLAALLHNEYFCQYVHDTVMDCVKSVEGTAKRLLNKDEDAMSNLMSSLVLVGIMMAYVGNSRPASGSEHHYAHFFEITGILKHHDYYLHGIDVLYSAAMTAKLREELLKLNLPFKDYDFDRPSWEKEMNRVYLGAAKNVIALQDKIGNYARINIKDIEAKWHDVQDILSSAPTFEQMKKYVDDIGLNMDEYFSFYGEDVLNDAKHYAKDLKDRYTVLWLYHALVR